LAKNLVLSGANLTIVDDKLIDEYDVDTNFFFGNSELGQSRGEVGRAKLNEINPLAKILLAPFISV